MDNNKKDQNQDPENVDQKATDPNETSPKFNAGGNDSDYDGGHPKDGFSKTKARTDLTEEKQKETNGKSFNAGGNDSDYDGGHP